MNDGLVAHTILESTSGYAQTIRSGHHSLTADEPGSAGGTDTGPAPYALVLAGLGACTAITLRMYAQRKGWELGTIHVDLRLYKDGGGDAARIERFIRFGGDATALSDEQRAKLLEIADKTPVTKTIRAGAPIETKLA